MISILGPLIADAGYGDEIPLFDDIDAAFIGIGSRADGATCAVYSYKKTVECFEKLGMTYEDAIGWVSYNLQRAWLGQNTPIFVDDLTGD